MNTKMKMRMLSLLLCFVMLVGLMPTTVWATSAGAEESYALSITNKPGTTFVLSQGEYTSDVCDLWNEIDSDGTGELKFDQSFGININDAVEVYNNFIDTQYPDGDREHYKALEDNNNGAIFYVQARVLINDYEYQFSSKASYMYAPYGLDGEYNEGCGEWNISSYYDDLSDFLTISKDGGVLNLSLDGTVKEIYEALKEQDETLGDVTVNDLTFELRVSCEVEYTGSWGSTNYTELSFEAISHSLYDKHIFESASEYDNLSVIPITAPLTVNVVPAYEGCYEPVNTEYSWYYEFIKEGEEEEENGEYKWYGYFERDESKESDVLTETAPSGTIYGIAYGKVDSDSNSITLDDILNEDNKDFINSFIGEKPRELGGKGQMFIGCDVTLTFEDGKQWVVYITKADYMSRLIIPCMHACTVCGLCTVTDEMLPCNFDQMSYDISNVCICDEPSVPEFEVTLESEKQLTIESTDTTVKVVVEKIEVEETPTHSFIVNTTDAVGADNVMALYNINVFNEEGYPYTLNQWGDMGEELTVSVPVSMEEALALQSGEAALYHILADGTAEEVEGVTVVIDGESATMTFTSDSFSPYVVARTATTYTVTVTGGTASPAGPNAEGTEVTVTATPPANMGFKQWNGLDGVAFVDDTNKQSATATFKMPARAVEATAVYGINNVTATATGNIKPVLGNNAETNPTFTYNFPELTTMSNSCWRYSSDGEEWEYAGYTEATKKFCVGYWYFDLNARLNGLSISDPCTVTVNGTKWQIIRPSVNLAAESPVYYLDAEGNVSVVMFEIDGVTATCPAMPDSLSAEATLPHLAFTPTPTQAVVRGDGTWQKKSGDNWVNVSGAAEAGKTYRYKTKMHIDSSAATHTFTDDVTLKVNGTSWTVDYTTMQETGTSSVSVMVYSPEYTVAETYTVSFAANGGTGTMADVTGVSGEYELPACTFTAPAGKQFKAWSVGSAEKAVGDKITVTADTTVTAVWENVSTKTPIDTVNISDLAKPVVGEMPNNSITVNGTGVTVDDEGSYWGRFVSPSFSPVYDDDTAVDSVVFREGETYMFQLYLNAAAGYEFTADSKFYFASELLPAPDMTDLSKSFAMVNPSDSTQAVIYINMNDIAHVHVPGDWDFNDTHHWHKCTASGCDAGADVSRLPDYAEHIFVNGLCTCGAHKHSWSADWFVNETHHWHECSANGCTVTDNSGKDGYAAHDFTAGACVCGVENVITSIEINGITSPVAGETPINSASVDKVGAEVDEENTFWVRYDVSTGRTSDTYANGTSVHDTPFRDREIYLLQITIKPKTGYSFTADTKLLYGGTALSAPDAANPTASCGAIAPDCSMAMALINPTGASAPLTYTVSFVANGGTGTMADVTVESGAEYTLPANGFTAPAGKQFKSWSVGGAEKAVGDKITVTANTTVTAVWENIPVVTYTVTFNANGGSVTPASAETGADGKLASLPTPTRSGSYSFKGWYTATSGGTKVTTSTVFNANTTIYAQWTYTGGGGGYYPTTYSITVKDSKNGDITVSPIAASKGTTVTILVTPDTGYTLETLTATDKNGKESELTKVSSTKYTFKMPASKVTVEGTFMDDNTMLNFFVDVPADAYYYDAVLWAVKEGITNGTSATTFSPDNPCTRAQMVTFLWRVAGSPEPVGKDCPFVDVAEDTYYAKAVQWAYEHGVTGGTSATTYSPDETCTRGQMATFLSRVADGKPVSDKVIFADVNADKYYAKAVQWAYEQKITSGTSATTFSPDDPCTRAQMVTFLYRYFMK